MGICNSIADLDKESEGNKQERLRLIKKIKRNLGEEQEREEIYYNERIADLNNFNEYVESLPDNCQAKRGLTDNVREIYELENYYRDERNKRYSEIQAVLEDNIREIIYNEKETNRKIFAKKVIKQSVSTSLGFVPILSNAKGMIETITGKDLISDEELSTLDRFYTGVSSLPIIVDFIAWENWVMKILKKLFDF